MLVSIGKSSEKIDSSEEIENLWLMLYRLKLSLNLIVPSN